MSFHPDIISLESFVPHELSYLEKMRAWPEGSVPAPAYEKLKREYAAATDVDIKRITYLSDGLNITGLLAAPVGKCRGIVVYNRGGSGNYGMLTLYAVMRHFVPLARAGYLVVGSNYRGNDGGEGKDEFGGRDVDDVVKLHAIAKLHPAAKGPTYLIGHSRGGMTTFLMLKRGFPAKAAIGIAPVCDLTEWNAEGDRMRDYVYKNFIPGFAADEAGTLAARGAINWPDKINVPLLLMHGTNDEAVPHAQSTALSMLLGDTPHRIILYNGGNHSLMRQWGDVTDRCLEWLKQYG